MENLDRKAFGNEVVPFYFGRAPKKLYGCHHLPQTSSVKTFAVVLCPAIGQEYLQSHRVIYQLAVLLARKGFHVLRFDYSGCGDSEGDFEQGSVAQWVEDVHTATEEMQNRSGLTRVGLVGLRMGATLALRAATRSHFVNALILWEPVLNGNVYLSELFEAQRGFLRELASDAPRSLVDLWRYGAPGAKQLEKQEQDEVLGFPITSELRRELETINLDAQELSPAISALAVSSSDDSTRVGALLGHFGAVNPHVDLKTIADDVNVWKQFYKRLTPYGTLQHLVNWLDTVQS